MMILFLLVFLIILISLLMYDITSQKSYQKVNDLLKVRKENFKDKKFIICLIGNKIDLKSNRVIIKENTTLYSKNNNIEIFKGISSLNCDNIKNLLKK